MYRSYGLLLVIVALLITHQQRGERFPFSMAVAGLVLLVDLPLRWLGNKVPWRAYDVDYWPLSPYRGSHVFFIPTWLFGVAALGLGAACVVSPGFQALLEQPNLFKRDAAPPPPPAPVANVPAGKLEVAIEEVAPLDGTNFRVIYTNHTGVRLIKLEQTMHFKLDDKVDRLNPAPAAELMIGEKRSDRLPSFGKLTWIRIETKANSSDGRTFIGEGEWQRKAP